MKLLTNEQTITSSNRNYVVLTNLRIHNESKEWGHSYSNTLFLEDISSIEIKYNSSILLLILGALSLLAWGYQLMNGGSQTEIGMSILFIAVVSLLIYWFSRKHVIAITPNGGKPIMLLIARIGSEQILDFVDKLQDAKANRIKELYKL